MTTVLSRAGWAMGTGMGIGLAPLAPATVASLAAVLLYGFSPLMKLRLASSFCADWGSWSGYGPARL